MFRFSIRDVLWLTVVVGLAIGWFLTTRRLASERDAFEQKALESEGNFISLVEIVRNDGVKVEKIPGGLHVDMTGRAEPNP